VKPFLENIVERIRRSLADKGVIITSECKEGLQVNADPDRLSQIVINLVSNAIKAVERGGAVTIAALRTGPDFVLEVRDTGAGIKQEDLPFIFERFYKVSSGGLGLGLAIVRELVDAHGGRIDVKSEYGAGSVFMVHLPA
jgi:two-component system sensor histidine kinase BaeS